MSKTKAELGLNEEMMILLFWAHGIDILKRFSEEQLQAVPSLKEAIDVVSKLPGEIGWNEEPWQPPRRGKRTMRKAENSP